MQKGVHKLRAEGGRVLSRWPVSGLLLWAWEGRKMMIFNNGVRLSDATFFFPLEKRGAQSKNMANLKNGSHPLTEEVL